MRVGLTYNLRREGNLFAGGLPTDAEAEFDDPETVDAIRAALARDHEVVPVEADERAYDSLRRTRPDIVFNVAEGRGGPFRESHLPAILESLDIPYTGSDPLALALCLHKGMAKRVLAHDGVPTPPFVEWSAPPDDDPPFGYPAIVKPVHEGSSRGVRDDCVVRGRAALRDRVARIVEEYGQDALVEAFLPGREFTAAILGNGDDLRVLPLVAMNYEALPAGAQPIFGYEVKWVWDRPEKPLDIYECPARVPEGLADAVRDAARRAFRSTRCRDWCRVDLRLDARGVPNVLELNPLPGIIPVPEANSCFPKAARAAGIPYDELILTVLDLACVRLGLPARPAATARA